MESKQVEPLKARFTQDKHVYELMALDKSKVALYRVSLRTRVSYHVGHIEVVPESEPELSSVTKPAHEDFVTDIVLDNEKDVRQAYTQKVLLKNKEKAAKPKRARRTKVTAEA